MSLPFALQNFIDNLRSTEVKLTYRQVTIGSILIITLAVAGWWLFSGTRSQKVSHDTLQKEGQKQGIAFEQMGERAKAHAEKVEKELAAKRQKQYQQQR